MKKVLATLLASTMALSAMGGLAACGGDTPKQTLGGSMDELTVWAPQAAIAGYQALVEGFKTANPSYKDVKITFQAKPEGEVETALATDPAAGADVFFFESGQINNMMGKNLLQPMVGDYAKYATAIKERDGEANWKAVAKGDQLYAFPATNDNGWFLWYDSEFYSENDVKSLDTMLAKAKEAGKKVMLDYGNGWYIPTFWMGAGNKMDFQVSEDGKQTYVTDIDNDRGKAVANAMLSMFTTYAKGSDATLLKQSSDLNSEIPNGMIAGSVVAGFIGTWVQSGGKRSFHKDSTPTDLSTKPDSYTEAEWTAITTKGVLENGVWKTDGNGNLIDKDGTKIEVDIPGMPAKAVPTVCPTFKVGTEDVQMGTFYGGKYCGVNPRRVNKAAAAAFADWMTNEAGQLARYGATKAGPTNKNLVANNATIKTDKALSALNNQIAVGGYAQQSQASKFWDAMGAFGNALATQPSGFSLDTELTNLVKSLRLG